MNGLSDLVRVTCLSLSHAISLSASNLSHNTNTFAILMKHCLSQCTREREKENQNMENLACPQVNTYF